MERRILSYRSSGSRAALRKYLATSKESNKCLQLGLPRLLSDPKHRLLFLLELLLLGLLLQSPLLQELHLRRLLLHASHLPKLHLPGTFIRTRRLATDPSQLYGTNKPRLLRFRLFTEVIR